MIRSFKDKETEQFFNQKRIARFQKFEASAHRKINLLDSTIRLEDLSIPGLNLESLKGDRKGQHSIRINAQWRICFEWYADGAYNVEIVDYH